jgi:hypothetical protein
MQTTSLVLALWAAATLSSLELALRRASCSVGSSLVRTVGSVVRDLVEWGVIYPCTAVRVRRRVPITDAREIRGSHDPPGQPRRVRRVRRGESTLPPLESERK